MATESAANTELSVTLSSSLAEWLEQRATALGVDRETLLVQLVGTYRTAADVDPDELESLLSELTEGDDVSVDADGAAIEELDDRIGEFDGDIDDLEGRIDGLEATLDEHVEDLRSRILQLKDAVESRAPETHDHAEIDAATERLDELSSELETVETEFESTAAAVDEIASDLESTDERLEVIEGRLGRLARVVLELKRHTGEATHTSERLEALHRSANRHGTSVADCGGCGKRLQIGLLTEAACPHCEMAFEDIEYPSSLFGWFKSPTLIGPETPDGEPPPEAESEKTDDADPAAEWEPKVGPKADDE